MTFCKDHLWIPLPDGSRLGARLWLPDSVGAADSLANDIDVEPGQAAKSNANRAATESKVPAILEYIPYRKDDYSATRDSTTIAWFATQGYACLRVDMRGSGSSDGILSDEYSEQEIDDGVEVINWIAAQPWCDGNVGTIGISWGGITGLQMAQRQPEALKTVIALGATEYRYYDDGSYYMGCMTGQTIGWAAIMFGYNTRPPDPALVGEQWRDLWLQRLRETPHYLDHFLTHQREDDYWLRGTVGTDYAAVKVPVYAVSGHADCWPNTVSRLLEHLEVPTRGLQGAWCHRYPHLGIPGPTVDFLPDALRWFDHWLRGQDTGMLEEAGYQVYVQDSVRPKPYYAHRPGNWIGERGWPSTQIHDRNYFLGDGELSDSSQPPSTQTLSSPQTVGLAGGEYMPWFAFGPADELPDDQQPEDKGSLCFDTPALSEPVEIIGNAVFDVRVSCNKTEALLAVRLCDVWPDGQSTLITRGLLNLCQRHGKGSPEPLQPGSWYQLKVTLNHTGYRVAAGHQLRLACSNCYWPIAWPSSQAGILSIDTSTSTLSVPVRDKAARNEKLTRFSEAEIPEPIATTQMRPVAHRREISVDPATGNHTLEIYADNGSTRFENNQVTMASTNLQRYTIHPDNPLSAKAEYEWVWDYSRDDKWITRTFTRTEMTCDEQAFHVSTESTAWENDEEVHHQKTNNSYKRDFF